MGLGFLKNFLKNTIIKDQPLHELLGTFKFMLQGLVAQWHPVSVYTLNSGV